MLVTLSIKSGLFLDRMKKKRTISVLVPVFNEQANLIPFHQRLSVVLDSLEYDSEIVFINDGSSDDSEAIILQLREKDPRIALINLSRNFGKEIAMCAGIDHADSDATVIIDADLQDPPELIPSLLLKWNEGYDAVYAQRSRRQGESGLRKIFAFLFYRILNRSSSIDIPIDTGDYRVLSRRSVDALRQFKEQHRYMKGLFSWIGFKQTAISYDRDPRNEGSTAWNFWSLWNFALEGITSFSTSPLKASTYFGLTVAIISFLFGMYVIVKTLVYGSPVPGYPSLMTVIVFLGGVQLIAIGVLGEYLGRTFDEAKNRPLYFVDKLHRSQSRTNENPDG